MGTNEQAKIERELTQFYDAESTDRVARHADQRFTATRRIVQRDAVVESDFPRPPASILDVGAGPGLDTESFVNHGFNVTSLDLSHVSTRRCLRLGAHGVSGSMVNLPFAEDSFDCLWSMSALMHVADDAIAGTLTELRRVARPGAVCVVGAWGGDDETAFLAGGEYGPDRFFRHRSDATWQSLLTNYLGPIERYESWEPLESGAHYQWALLRTA